MKERWGKKINYIRTILVVITLSAIGCILGFFLVLFKTPQATLLIGVSYMGAIFSALAAAIFAYGNKDDIRQRKEWLIEINQFNSVLNAYKFNDQDIERMIVYIDEYRTKEFERSRRKFDVFWGFISVTTFSFVVSIGKSIWDSYGFKGDEALKYGTILIIMVILCVILFLMPIYVIYDSVVKVPKEEEGLKRALQEALFSRNVEMIVTKHKSSEVLIEDDLNISR